MKSKQINRRDFINGAALVAGATILTACAPAASSTVLVEPTRMPADQIAALKIWIIYDSVYGNTEKIAQAIQEGLGSGSETRLVKAVDAKFSDMGGKDILIVGSPTHAGQYTEPIKNFLNAIPENGLQNRVAAAFDTGSATQNQGAFGKFMIGLFGYASPRIAKALATKGAAMLAAETFFVLGTEGPLREGEIERAGQWANGVTQKI